MFKKKYRLRKQNSWDFQIFALVLLLSLFGIVMVFSASYYSALSKYNNPYKFLREDLMWNALGFVALIFFSLVDYKFWRHFAWPAIGVTIVLLLLIFTPIGITINNARRWLDFKLFTIMPGEVAKTAIILFTAKMLADNPNRVLFKRFRDGFWPDDVMHGFATIVAITGVCFFLIMRQPNFSTAGTLLLIVCGMLFVAGINWGVILLGVGALGALFMAIINLPQLRYIMVRVETFFDPFKDALGTGYQVVQGLLALGSGGLTGKGLGQSVQKMLYLPEPQNDFILAIIGEELGLIGIFGLMALYIWLIYRCLKVCIGIKDYFGMMLASGITMHLAFQVILNIAVVSASFMPTGVILPFVSQGGNATLLFLSEMGILLNISKQAQS